MTKKTLNLVIALSLGTVSRAAAQSPIEGHWEGVMVRGGAQLNVSFNFSVVPTGFTGDFNSPSQRAAAIPLRNVAHKGTAVHFELAGDITTSLFDGEVAGRAISGQFREGAKRNGQFHEGDARTGQFREGDARGTFSLMRTESQPASFTDEEVTFRSADVVLSGTLLLPLGKGPHPAIVFLHGSGAEGRYASR